MQGLTYSILLHSAFLLMAAFGLPALMPPPVEPEKPTAITVEILTVKDISNIKKSRKPISAPKAAPKAKHKRHVQKTISSKPKPVEAKDVVSMPSPDTKTKAPVVIKKKKTKPKKKKNNDFALLMSKLKQESKQKKTKAKPSKAADKNKPANKSRSESYDNSIPLSISQRDAILNQFIRCWRMPAGARNDYNLAVKIRVTVDKIGNVTSANIAEEQNNRYFRDTFFRAAADSALRAVHICSPLQNLPQDKYGTWKDMELTFDPRDVLY